MPTSNSTLGNMEEVIWGSLYPLCMHGGLFGGRAGCTRVFTALPLTHDPRCGFFGLLLSWRYNIMSVITTVHVKPFLRKAGGSCLPSETGYISYEGDAPAKFQSRMTFPLTAVIFNEVSLHEKLYNKWSRFCFSFFHQLEVRIILCRSLELSVSCRLEMF